MLEIAVGARGDHHAQVGRRVAQQVGQRLARGLRQALGLVDDQHDVERRSAPLRPARPVTPSRPRRRRRPSSSVWPNVGRPAPTRTASARLCTKRVGLVRGCADSQATTAAVRQVLAAPLRQQRGLAEAGRRLHQHDRAVAQLVLVDLQPRPGHQLARHARRRHLQQQVVGDAVGVSRRKSRHGFRPSAVGRRVGGDGMPRDCCPVAMVASAGGAVVTSYALPAGSVRQSQEQRPESTPLHFQGST